MYCVAYGQVMIGITLRILVQRNDIRNDKKCAMKKGKREIRKKKPLISIRCRGQEWVERNFYSTCMISWHAIKKNNNSYSRKSTDLFLITRNFHFYHFFFPLHTVLCTFRITLLDELTMYFLNFQRSSPSSSVETATTFVSISLSEWRTNF